jgi:hypothetical protein
MNDLNSPKEHLLSEIDNKLKAIINLGKQLSMISSNIYLFDIFLIAALNRTINISKAYVSLIRDGNFIAAAPLVRINIDTLLRLYASTISEYDRNTFALNVLKGKLIKEFKIKGTRKMMRDSVLCTELSNIKGMDWVSDIYRAGSSFIHMEKSHIISSLKFDNEQEMLLHMTIGFHDKFIPDSEKYGSAMWMNKIIDSIVEQAQLWMLEKAEQVGYDLHKLNNIK